MSSLAHLLEQNGLMYLEGKTKAKRATKILEGRKCAKIQGNGLRFSLWLFRYFLKTYVYTPSTPCRDVKFCPNIPLGDLSWNSLTEVMWHHQINGFSNILKKLTRNVHVGLENDWSGSFVLLYGWNKEDVRWDFALLKSIGKLWAI